MREKDIRILNAYLRLFKVQVQKNNTSELAGIGVCIEIFLRAHGYGVDETKEKTVWIEKALEVIDTFFQLNPPVTS